jgi:biopolymer transport protein ExbD
MAKFGKKTAVSQDIPMEALPDIIFILLFFFMVTTKMRKTNVMVDNKVPSVTQLQKLDRTLEKAFLYIGKPLDASMGKEPRIQVNDQFITPNDIPRFINEELAKLPPAKKNKSNLIVVLNVDSEAKMGMISDVKQQLREVDTRRISYIAKTNRKHEN